MLQADRLEALNFILAVFFPKVKDAPFFRNAAIIIFPKVNFGEHSREMIRFNIIHHLRNMVTYPVPYGSIIMITEHCSLASSIQTRSQFLVQ